MPRTLALIPARGGSKSISKKNIVNLGGKPLISYVIEALKRSKSVERIIVSTDDEEIASVAREHGAEAPFLRPPHLAGDAISTIPAIEHALLWLEENEGYRPEYVALAQSSEPFLQSEHVDSLFRLVCEKNADSGITMVPIPRTHHPYHVRRIKEDGCLEFDNPELHYAHPNRQSDPKRYAFGNLYWFKRDMFLKEKRIEVGRRVGLEIDSLYAHDINEPLDLEIAKILINKLKKS